MKKFSIVFFVIFTLVLGSVCFAQTSMSAQNKSLASLLPASDGVVNIDLKRLMSDALPQILSTNPEVLTEINEKINEVQTRTGLDLHQFEQVAIGVSFKQISDKETDYAPLILARGKFNAAALLALAKIAAKGKYREEKLGNRTIFVFDTQEIIQDNRPKTVNSKLGKYVDKALNSMKNEIAVTTYDDNTLAIGTLARVKETFGTTRINPSVLAFLNRKPNAILSFGANTVAGLTPFFSLDNDEIGKVLGGIRTVYGSLDTANGNVVIAAAAKSANLQNAKDLEESLAGLQMIGKGLLGGVKGGDKEVYGRMIDNAKITRTNMEVALDLQVAQTDINLLLGKK